MTSPKLAAWFYVSVKLADINTGTVSTYLLSNRAIPASSSVFHPILIDIPSAGAVQAGNLPGSSSGSIILDNSPGSLGEERRFSDLLELASPIDQEVAIYGAATDLSSTDPTSDFVQLYKATMRGFTLDARGGTISITVDASALPRRPVTKMIDTATDLAVPTANLGKHLPLVFGSGVEVSCIRTTSDGDILPRWAYATNLGTQYTVGGVQSLYAKVADEWRPITSAATISTHLYGRTDIPNYYASALTNLEIYTQFTTGNSAYIVTNGVTSGYWGTTGAITTGLEFAIFDSDGPGGAPGTKLASGAIPDVGTKAAVAIYSIAFSLSVPVILQPNHNYFFMRYAYGASVGTDWRWAEKNTPTAQWTKTSGTNTTPVVSIITILPYSLYGVVVTDNSSGGVNSEGLGHSYFHLSQTATGGLYSQVAPDISKLEFIAVINGLRDDAIGTLTGVAYTSLNNARYALALLGKTWNGSTWTGQLFDFTAYSGSHANINGGVTGVPYYRLLTGRTEGRVLWADLVEEICRNSACRVCLLNTTTSGAYLGVYAWGTTAQPAAVFSDEEAEIGAVTQAGTETLVNHARIFYSRSVKDTNLTLAASESNFRSYLSTMEKLDGSDTQFTNLCHRSATIYGDRQLANSAFNFLGDTVSADNVLKSIFATYGQPIRTVPVDVPLFKYRSLKIFDIVEFLHPDLPSHYGTASQAVLPHYRGTPCAGFNKGHYWKRAKRYRAIIEGWQIVANVSRYPKLRLTCRLLTNFPIDLT